MSTPLSRLITAATEAADELEWYSMHEKADRAAAALRAALADMAYTPPAGVDWNAVGPELVEALKLLVLDCKGYEAWARPVHALNVAEAAIAKASQ
jgi:N-acetyl-beta-hexosaminidase